MFIPPNAATSRLVMSLYFNKLYTPKYLLFFFLKTGLKNNKSTFCFSLIFNSLRL